MVEENGDSDDGGDSGGGKRRWRDGVVETCGGEETASREDARWKRRDRRQMEALVAAAMLSTA